MEKIPPISTNLVQNYTQSHKVVTEPIKQVQSAPEIAPEIVKKETADAAKAYSGIVAPKPRPLFEKKSLDELKSEVLAQGKVEGKDFKIDKQEKVTNMEILENDKPVKLYVYDNPATSADNLYEYQEYSYPTGNNGLKEISAFYDGSGDFKFRSFTYDPENSPYKNEIVNAKAKPQDLRKYLDENNIRYATDIQINENDIWTTKFTTFEPKTNDVIVYEFSYYEKDCEPEMISVEKKQIGKNGNLLNTIAFHDTFTSYTEFTDK